jgi:hypothetical protein
VPFRFNSLVNVALLVIRAYVFFYILLILGPFKELKGFLDFIMSS